MELLCGAQVLCAKRYTVGFKKVEIRGEKIYFNGMPLFVRGVNRHDLTRTMAGLCRRNGIGRIWT